MLAQRTEQVVDHAPITRLDLGTDCHARRERDRDAINDKRRMIQLRAGLEDETQMLILRGVVRDALHDAFKVAIARVREAFDLDGRALADTHETNVFVEHCCFDFQ